MRPMDPMTMGSTGDLNGPHQLMYGLRATVIQQKCSLPTPPESDTGLEHADWCKGVERNRSSEIPSYCFVSIPQSPCENNGASTRSSPFLRVPSISSCSTPEPQCNTFESTFPRDTVTSSGVFQLTRAPELGFVTGPTPPAPKKPLLNLIWRDIGNGISRAYPRHDLPPLLSPEHPGTSPTLIEGLDYFVYSDEETTISQGSVAKDVRTDDIEGSQGRSFLHENGLRIPCEPLFSQREPSCVFSCDSDKATELMTLHLMPKAAVLPTHTFIPTPQLTTAQFTPTPEPGVSRPTSTSKIHTSHNFDDQLPSNVQPTHLTPPHLLSARKILSRSIETEQYNPNISSGFQTPIPTPRPRRMKPAASEDINLASLLMPGVIAGAVNGNLETGLLRRPSLYG